jgi:hypothetical protein
MPACTGRRDWRDRMADAGDTAAEAAANRDLRTRANREYGDEHGDQAWDAGDITWGVFNVPGQQLGVPGDVRGVDVLEPGCGTAYFSAWLARRGARPAGVDLTRGQLATAALPGAVRRFRPAHRGRRGGCPAAVGQLRPGRVGMRSQLVVRPGPPGSRGRPAGAGRRAAGLPHHQRPGRRVLPGSARARPPGATAAAARGTPAGNRPGRHSV